MARRDSSGTEVQRSAAPGLRRGNALAVAGCTLLFLMLLSTLSIPSAFAVTPNAMTGKVYVEYAGGSAAVIKGAVLSKHSAPTGGTGLQAAYDPQNKEAFFPNQDTGTVTVLDTLTDTVAATITGFTTPIAALYVPSNKMVYVFDSGNLFEINPATNAVSLAINLGALGFTYNGNPVFYSSPILAYSSATKEIYLVDSPICSNGCPTQGSVWVVKPSNNKYIATISLPTGGCPCYPSSIGSDPANGDVFVGDTETGYIYVIDSANTVTSTMTGFSAPSGFAYDPTNQLLYFTDNGDPSFSYYGGVYTLSPTLSLTFVSSTFWDQPTQIAYDTHSQMIYAINHGDDEVIPISGTTAGTPIGLHVQLSEIVAT
jgi:YVTN family beta-propeller protein